MKVVCLAMGVEIGFEEDCCNENCPYAYLYETAEERYEAALECSERQEVEE